MLSQTTCGPGLVIPAPVFTGVNLSPPPTDRPEMRPSREVLAIADLNESAAYVFVADFPCSFRLIKIYTQC